MSISGFPPVGHGAGLVLPVREAPLQQPDASQHTESVEQIGAQQVAPPIPMPQAEDPIERVISLVKAVLPEQQSKLFIKLLSEGRNLNVQYEGWTLLHYCAYLSENMSSLSEALDPKGKSLEKIRNMLALIEYLISHGANVESKDMYGRTPIYFLSGNNPYLKDAFLTALLKGGASVNPPNEQVQPLHVIGSLVNTYVIDLLNQGADVYAIDKYGRMPLHCVVCNQTGDQIYNVRALVHFAPFSTAHADRFGNYPLYYALIFGSDEVITCLVENTPDEVINEIVQKIDKEGIPESDEGMKRFEDACKIYDEIYRTPQPFRLIFGGMPSKKHKNVAQAVQQVQQPKVKPTYEKDGQIFYLHADRHGGKHVNGSNKYQNDKDLVRSTLRNPATFYSKFAEKPNYEALLQKAIKSWADKGADPSASYYENDEPVGGDGGKETCNIEIYYGGEIGSHMRPKAD